MKKIVHKVICIKTSKVLRYWNQPQKSLAIRSLYLFGKKVKDIEVRRATKKEFMNPLLNRV